MGLHQQLVAGCIVISLIAVSCSTGNGANPYSKRLVELENGEILLTMTSESGMSEESLRKALLSEASRTAIDRGAVYLRIEELRAGNAVTVVERTASASEQSTGPSAGETTEKTSFSLGRQRSGEVRFTVSQDPLAGANAFEASSLLDQLRRGQLPEALR